MNKPNTLNEYLAMLPGETKATVHKIRAIIKKTAPNAEEGLSYGVGGFKLNNKYFI